MLLCRGILSRLVILHCIWSFSKYSMHCPDAWIYVKEWLENTRKSEQFKSTLIATVRTDAMTSSDPLRMRLLGNNGSYSHMAVAVSIATILVIWLITAMFVMLTTCPKHLNGISVSQEIPSIEKVNVRKLLLFCIPLIIRSSSMNRLNCCAACVIT